MESHAAADAARPSSENYTSRDHADAELATLQHSALDTTEPPADLLAAVLSNEELCKDLKLRPADVSSGMLLYEALAINFLFDMGITETMVRTTMPAMLHCAHFDCLLC